MLPVTAGELVWGGSGPPEYTSFALEAVNTRTESCSVWPLHIYTGVADPVSGEEGFDVIRDHWEPTLGYFESVPSSPHPFSNTTERSDVSC